MNDLGNSWGGLALFTIVVVVAAYVLSAYVLFRIGSKFRIGSFAEYCFPIYRYVPLCRAAGISPWLSLALLVPLVNFAFIVYLFGSIARKLNHDFWLFGLGMLLFGIPALILAFDDSKPTPPKQTTTIPKPSIYCISGEFTGSRLPVDGSGIIFGRSPATSQVVLESSEVSASHARVWSDPQGRIWIKDMSSLNGTYYSNPSPGDAPQWIKVLEAMPLPPGAHFRLGENAVEFVVS